MMKTLLSVTVVNLVFFMTRHHRNHGYYQKTGQSVRKKVSKKYTFRNNYRRKFSKKKDIIDSFYMIYILKNKCSLLV